MTVSNFILARNSGTVPVKLLFDRSLEHANKISYDLIKKRKKNCNDQKNTLM